MQLYICEVDENLLYPCEKIMPLLSAEKRQRIEKFHFRVDVLRSLLGDVLLRYGLEKLGVDEKKLDFIYGEHKKPYLKDNPYYFNLSHSGKYIACCIGKEELGVDIQEKITLEREKMLSLAESFFAEEEYQDMITKEDPEDYFFALWTLKETYLKYKGEGLYLSLKSIVFQLQENKVSYYSPYEKEEVFFYTALYHKEYRLSLCSREKNQQFMITDLSSQELLNYAERL